jgi:hypothetical protein
MKKIFFLTGLILVLLLNVATAGAQSNDSQSGKMPVLERFLENNRLVIDDRVFRLAENAQFFDANQRIPLQPSDFKEGQRVGFMINNNGEIEMMWKAE